MALSLLTTVAFACSSVTFAFPQSQPYKHALSARQDADNDSLTVDLGYGIYQGYSNASTGINTWRGIRFAAPPTGSLRWQRPEVPATNRTKVQAQNYGSACPQNGPNPPSFSPASSTSVSEDCLFLNVQSPANAKDLPVLVWIHGGGYGAGSGLLDFSDILATNDNSFVAVSIQYRLGPFGFLASDEMNKRGVVNAGLLDQMFALQWVQAHIREFGGDPLAVTITGESAGGGSVMLMDMAYNGTLGDSLFQKSIAASPYLPKQYHYNDRIPSQNYDAFANAAGCSISGDGNTPQTIFDCLLSKDTATLQNAAFAVTASVTYGTWAFLPVTDDTLVQSRPSDQLLHRRINGRSLLVGNNANEGSNFTPQMIGSESALLTWLRSTLPEFTDDDLAKVLKYYPTSEPSSLGFATNGVSGASALDTSSVSVGQQQRANNIYAELTFVCPSYWMAEAYSGENRTSYKYQYSALPGLHGQDTGAYFSPLGSVPYLSTDYQRAFMRIWGNFVTASNPSISNELASGSLLDSASENVISNWPMFSKSAPYQMNLNQTGGTLVPQNLMAQTHLTGPSLMNNFTLANAFTWEAGRGARCDFWRSVGSIIPA